MAEAAAVTIPVAAEAAATPAVAADTVSSITYRYARNRDATRADMKIVAFGDTALARAYRKRYAIMNGDRCRSGT